MVGPVENHLKVIKVKVFSTHDLYNENTNPNSYMHNHLEYVSVCIVQYLCLRYGNVDGETYSLYSDQS